MIMSVSFFSCKWIHTLTVIIKQVGFVNGNLIICYLCTVSIKKNKTDFLHLEERDKQLTVVFLTKRQPEKEKFLGIP